MSSLGAIFSQTFPPSPKWSVDSMPNLTGKVAIVTGGNAGLGKETCRHLLLKGCTVWLAARSKVKAEAAIEELKEETGGKEALFLELDLSDLNKVKEAAETFISRSSNLNMLICNAGAMLAPIEELSVQGYDLHFGVNALGHFLFIQKLLPLLKSLSSPTTQSRIVWVSSSAHYYFIHHPINSENLRDTPSRKKLDSFQLYCQSKFVTTMLAYRLAEELDKQLEEGEGSTGNSNKSPNVICIHLDPGNIDTDVWRNMDLSWLTRKFLDLTLYPVSFGVLSQLFAATALEATGYNGKYLQPWARLGEPNPATKDNAEQEKLWTFCMDAIKDYI